MSNRLPITFIFITVVIDAMGIGLILPVMPDLIRELEGGDIGEAAVWGGILATAFAVMQFLFGPLLGNLSDRFGRRPVLLTALAVMAIDYLVMAVAGTIWLLFLGRIIGGITAASQSTAMAYMADISRPEEKSQNFGLIGAAFGVGFVLGPLIGGLLAEYGTRAPFYAAAALAATNFVFGFFVLPETVTDAIRRPFSLARANPLGAFRNLGRLPGLRPLLAMTFFYGIAFYVYPAIWAYFGQERFGWGPGMVGVSLALYGISIAVVQGILIRPILARIGDRNAVILGLGLEIAAFVFLAFVKVGWMALAFTLIAALGAIAGPALQGTMSRMASDNQQGELQGTLTAINAVAVIFAPVLMTQTFYAFTHDTAGIYLPGAPFLLSAVLTFVCIALFLVSRPQPRPRPA
ncbi:TCR/Tet family MFS transporter [Ponticoccus sp. SC2-23]|uniref:TCR/Tet family MFS transporter n=1 Tax=Alexandriicola marinus TaxID=2081710 RepID=UPI000FDC8EB0|nr:TCR/Tet family MFS transporter [Alexandriicola marinus]MBM1222195.1 TCR/Tet family MFS transporter [Ponticoccus sp. SC6-9]MBM1226882.1 TCR/Tet family MFS transporter [Ponticoccus sp. SC6-15]MBM1231142.1 TCR/Tet family MFS transporter [Ponticoccus sp. SC6-38]MBM1235606.1 TCR/Tet family MFS transporter [Ponticoccus sp. SC6-45]MBM1240164.1 TCR/Tet family MFS transporter [Ponticoccus sp. SC6-49]MBM1244518.1 TCR/Tet family MFS transporter [Ponticoccus sp. SC2-64]MBM1249080.1 TCR/Tet family MFS